MSSLTRSQSMCPTGLAFEERNFDHVVAAKHRIMAPPMKYELQNADANHVYNHIKELTKNDPEASKYLEQIKPNLYASHRPIVFGFIPAPPIEEITRKVIGVKGYFFKMTTSCCGVYFIWHDQDRNNFLFWGPSTFKTVKAMNSIRWRIIKCCELGYRPHNEDDDDDSDEDEMPALISSGNTPDYEHPEPC